jgi:hypothetical protein
MNDSELRELDAWIAEHVFGLRFEELQCRSKTPEFTGVFVNHHIKQFGSVVKYPQGLCIGSFRKGGDYTLELYSPRFTTDSVASMELLKKCAEIVTVTVGVEMNRGIVARINDETGHQDYCKCAPTLELSICLFAKQLFTK